MDETSFPDECAVLRQLSETPEILQAVREYAGNEFQIQKVLRRRYPADLVRAALTLHDLRIHARSKFTRADAMWFDRKGLEQATSETVARHKAKRFSGAMLDLCCGIGGDAMALAARGTVRAVDVSAAACWRVERNAEVYGVEQTLEAVHTDVKTVGIQRELVHIDPDRRHQGSRRQVRVEEGMPGLDYLEKLIERTRGGAIKLSPASNFGGKFDGCEIELISLNGECKEATVWFGELAGTAGFRATVLPANVTIAGHPMDALPQRQPPQSYIYDPDPAVVRSGLLDVAAVELGLARLDDADEYLTGDTLVQSPFVQTFELLDELPNNDRVVRQYFRTHPYRDVEVKCRQLHVDARTVRRRLPLKGKGSAVVIYARTSGRASVLVCRRVGRSS